MNFDGFLGNGALKARLQESFRQGKTSHCYLLCGVEGSGRRTLALRMAAALECRDETNPGCGVCPACRKVLSGQHPDVITVDDTEHKNVAVDIIRQARSDVFIRPNEGRKKVYILPRGQDLGAPSQNALLKILEEPPDYAVFLLLTTSAEKLLPTIRSRAVQLQLSPLTPGEALPELRRRFPDESEQNLSSALEQAEGYLGPACEALKDGLFSEPALGLANGFAARDTLALLQVLVPMEKYKREQVLPVLEQTRKRQSRGTRRLRTRTGTSARQNGRGASAGGGASAAGGERSERQRRRRRRHRRALRALAIERCRFHNILVSDRWETLWTNRNWMSPRSSRTRRCTRRQKK